ncbi:MAG: hypothetical protein D6781_04460 [Verrucomicrobia bacterium]|nr:MAG: hypothetical protein D6781_04460 [Verrucomicrobiota bacterium]
MTASDGSTVVASAQPITAQDAQIGWAGSYLGVNLAQGPVVWDGSVYALVVGENVSVPGYTADIPNRAGNPPEQPVLRASPLGLAVSASGQVAFSGTVDDRATPLVESAWEIVGIAGAGSLRQLAESSRPGVLQVFSSEGLVRLVDDIGQVNTGTGVETIVGWLDENGGEQRLWGHGDSAPGASGQKFTTAFDVLAHLPDKTLVVKVDVSPDGSFADSESVVYLVDPSGVVEFLFKMVGEPFAGVAGLVNAGTMNITDKREFRDATSLDINTSRVIAFSALLVPTGATAQSAVLRRISATEREVVATAGTEATLAGGGSLGVFESVDGSRLSINDAGDIIFEGTLVGESGPTIFRYHAADGSFERIGPAPGTAVPGAAGFVVTKASLRASNAADRLVIRIDGRDENFVTKWGYFLQKAAGGFEPFIWDKQVTIGGETLTLTGFVGDIELSETNVASVSVPLPSGPAVIAAQIASETPPVGNQYHWDGGAGTNDWYTVTGGRSNWVDSVGTPWPTPPGPGSDVFISTGASVHLTQPATVQNVTLADENAELVVASDLTFEFLLDVPTLSQLTLESGSVNSTAGKLRVAGGLRKTTASACRIDVAILDYHGNEWQVQQGDLTLHNGESWLASDLIEVLDGSLVVQDEVTRVQGPGLQLTVRQTAQADLGSNAIVLESNLVLEAVDDLAKIFLGKSGQRQNGTDPIAFVGGTIQAQRSLEVKGAGEIVIRQGFSIEPERAFIINTTAPFDRPGLIVDLSAGDLIYFDIDSPEMVLLSRLDIRGGGVIGNLVNEGLIVAGCSEHAVRLDCRNESVIEQVGDVNTGGLINEAGSTYKIIEGRLEASYDPGYGDRVIFRMGSRLVAEGTGEVAILNREDPTAPTIPMFEGANITVTNDARLTLHGTRMTGVVDVAVDKKDGEIVFDGLEFEDLHITGDGLASFSGGIICRKLGGNAQRGDSYALIQEAPLFVNTRNVSIKDATFSSEDGAHWFFFDDDFSSLLDEFVIDTLKVQSGVLLEVAPISASARSLELNSFARFEDLALFSSVTVDPAIMSTVEKSDPEYPELRVEMTLYVRNEAGGDLVIEPRLGPGRYAFSPYVPIRNTRLFVPTTTHFDRETRTLRSGD